MTEASILIAIGFLCVLSIVSGMQRASNKDVSERKMLDTLQVYQDIIKLKSEEFAGVLASFNQQKERANHFEIASKSMLGIIGGIILDAKADGFTLSTENFNKAAQEYQLFWRELDGRIHVRMAVDDRVVSHEVALWLENK